MSHRRHERQGVVGLHDKALPDIAARQRRLAGLVHGNAFGYFDHAVNLPAVSISVDFRTVTNVTVKIDGSRVKSFLLASRGNTWHSLGHGIAEEIGDAQPAAKAAEAAGRRPKRTAIKRETIVRSAAKLFLERGYDSVSINDIIAVVGGSKETIYSNFGNKAKLFEAVVQQMCSDVTIRIDTRPIGSLEQQAHAHGAVVRFDRADAADHVLSPTGDFDRARISRRRGGCSTDRARARFIAIFSEWIAAQQKIGNIRADKDADRLAVLFHDMLIGEQILSWLTSASSPKDRARRIDHTVELAVTVFLSGCATDAGLKRRPPSSASRAKASQAKSS